MQKRRQHSRKEREVPLRGSRATAVVGGAALAILVVALIALFAGSRATQADLHAIPGQNVLLVTIDTLRADALGCYGGPANTPALDRLAAEGVRFDFAHAHAVLTLTSHASILTGRYPFQHGLRDNGGYRLPPETRTATTILKTAGYATAAFVAAFPVHSRYGLSVGFDVYDDRFGETRAPTEFIMPERPASEVVPLARSWIDAQAKTLAHRWFVWVHVFDPHAPYRPPPPFDAQYASRPYYGEVAATDAALAPLIEDLRGAARPTLVIVTGDHGEALGDHGEQSHGLFAYESTLRIPLIIAELGGSGADGAGRRTKGEVSSIAARHIDILPTILDAVGQKVPDDLPGRTLVPAFERRRGSAPRPSYFEAMAAMLNRGWAPLRGVLIGGDKYIDLPIPERYDLSADPSERSNLFAQSPERDRELAATLRAFDAPLPGQRVTERPRAAAELRALGYVSGRAPAKARYTEGDDPKRLVELDQLVHDAVEAFGNGHAPDAVQIYQRIIERRPDMTIAYTHLAFVERQRGRVTEAIDVLRRAVSAGVRTPSVLTQLAGYLDDAGRTREGMDILEPLAQDRDADADTLNTLGIAYARAGRTEDARRIFERVLEADPESSVPLENLGVLALERNDLATARQRFEGAVKADPRSSRAHGDLGVVLQRTGDSRGAISEWERAVHLDPTNYDALYNLGLTLAREGEMARARPFLEEFVRAAPPALYAQDLRQVSRMLQRSP